MRHLLRPVVTALVFALVGCTTTKYTPVSLNGEGGESLRFDHVRVTLVSGEEYRLFDAVITADFVRGSLANPRTSMKRGGIRDVEFARTDVTSLEHVYTALDGKKIAITAGVIASLSVVALLVIR
jgi:hypothetical protein